MLKYSDEVIMECLRFYDQGMNCALPLLFLRWKLELIWTIFPKNFVWASCKIVQTTWLVFKILL